MLDFIYHMKLTRSYNIARAHDLDMVNSKIKYLQRKMSCHSHALIVYFEKGYIFF